MKTVSEFLDAANRGEFTAQTGFGAQVISRAVSENVMPSGWYLEVREFCEARGIDVPEHLFRWSGKRQRSPKQSPSNGGL